MATTLYKKQGDEVVTERVKAEYVYALLQDGWVCDVAELEPKKTAKKEKKESQEELTYDD